MRGATCASSCTDTDFRAHILFGMTTLLMHWKTQENWPWKNDEACHTRKNKNCSSESAWRDLRQQHTQTNLNRGKQWNLRNTLNSRSQLSTFSNKSTSSMASVAKSTPLSCSPSFDMAAARLKPERKWLVRATPEAEGGENRIIHT